MTLGYSCEGWYWPVASFNASSLRAAIWLAIRNNVFDTAKATAYSGMLMLFPSFLVLTTLLALVPAGNTLLDALRTSSEQFLPADTMSLLQSYFQTQRVFSLQVLLSAASLAVFAALGVMLTLMEGFRRCVSLPGVERLECIRELAFLRCFWFPSPSFHSRRHPSFWSLANSSKTG